MSRRVTLRHVSDHFTVRLPKPTAGRLRRRAERSGLATRTLAQRYIEEGLRRDEHPLIYFVDGPTGRRAALVGLGLDVWEVIMVVRANGNDVAAAAEYLDRPLGLIEAAVAYYGAFRGEIDARVSANDEEADMGMRPGSTGRKR